MDSTTIAWPGCCYHAGVNADRKPGAALDPVGIEVLHGRLTAVADDHLAEGIQTLPLFADAETAPVAVDGSHRAAATICVLLHGRNSEPLFN